MSKTPPTLRPFFVRTQNFERGSDSPRAFLEECLGAFEVYEPEVQAFAYVDIEGARRASDRASDRWRRGTPLSPIDGMPIGIKDIVETVDMPTSQGSPLFGGHRSGRDAASVSALREAGAIILGKTVTTEFAATEPGKTRNPHDYARTPGGSSSGSAAAVASGVVPVASGTQVIGSVIRPASYCGCYGYKASIGAVNRGGSSDYQSQSCWGALAASLDDVWLVARAIVSRVGGDPGCPGLAGPDDVIDAAIPRAFAVIRTDGWRTAAGEARAAFERLVDGLVAADIRVCTQEDDSLIASLEQAVAEAFTLSREINTWEFRWPLNTYVERDPSLVSVAMKERLQAARAMTLDGHRALLDKRRRIRSLYQELSNKYDACITLAAPDVAPIGLASTGDPSFAVPASLLGVPAISLPAFQIAGLPLGLQLIGFEQQDPDLVSSAKWLQSFIGVA